MIDLQEAVLTKLYGVHDAVYNEAAPQEDESYPYVVVSFGNVAPRELREDVSIIVDVWDNKADDTMALDTLASNVNKALDKQGVHLQSGFIRIQRQAGAYQIPEPEPQLRRRQMRYRVKFYRID